MSCKTRYVWHLTRECVTWPIICYKTHSVRECVAQLCHAWVIHGSLLCDMTHNMLHGSWSEEVRHPTMSHMTRYMRYIARKCVAWLVMCDTTHWMRESVSRLYHTEWRKHIKCLVFAEIYLKMSPILANLRRETCKIRHLLCCVLQISN